MVIGTKYTSPTVCIYRTILTIGVLLTVASCSLWDAPAVDNDRSYDPIVELYIVNSLAETLTAIELDRAGQIVSSQDDAMLLGSVPNDIVASGSELVVTLSGENRLLLLDESTLTTLNTIDLGPGVNPMASVPVGSSLFATTGLFTGRVHLYSRGGYPALDDAGTVVAPHTAPPDPPAPQSIYAVATPIGGASEVRVFVANTAYSSSRAPGAPFGTATLAAFRFDIAESAGFSDGAPIVVLKQYENYLLETETNADAIASAATGVSGLNPQEIIDLPETGELLVIGAGVNYGVAGTGKDDGVVLVLDRSRLMGDPVLPDSGTEIVTQRIPIGGSPGAGNVVRRNDGGFTLITVGTSAIRAVHRPPQGSGVAGWTVPPTTTDAIVYLATGGIPFLSDIETWNDSIYVTDFGNDLLLHLKIDQEGDLELQEEYPVSDGPIALLLGWE